MIVLLILASLAAVYYISPMADRAVKPEGKPPKRGEARLKEVSEAVLTPGLVALGRALDLYGRGQQPLPAADGVGEDVRKTERHRL
jgi:hypothetical protein